MHEAPDVILYMLHLPELDQVKVSTLTTQLPSFEQRDAGMFSVVLKKLCS